MIVNPVIVIIFMTLVLVLNALVFHAAARFYTKTSVMFANDFERAEHRMKNPPWYVRYAKWYLPKRG